LKAQHTTLKKKLVLTQLFKHKWVYNATFKTKDEIIQAKTSFGLT
jgi:hypothetical protein